MLSIRTALKIIKILKLILIINSTEKNTIIFKFSGYVEGIYIAIYRNGFNMEDKSFYRENVLHLNSKYKELKLESEKKLDEIIEILKVLKKER